MKRSNPFTIFLTVALFSLGCNLNSLHNCCEDEITRTFVEQFGSSEREQARQLLQTSSGSYVVLSQVFSIGITGTSESFINFSELDKDGNVTRTSEKFGNRLGVPKYFSQDAFGNFLVIGEAYISHSNPYPEYYQFKVDPDFNLDPNFPLTYDQLWGIASGRFITEAPDGSLIMLAQTDAGGYIIITDSQGSMQSFFGSPISQENYQIAAAAVSGNQIGILYERKEGISGRYHIHLDRIPIGARDPEDTYPLDIATIKRTNAAQADYQTYALTATEDGGWVALANDEGVEGNEIVVWKLDASGNKQWTFHSGTNYVSEVGQSIQELKHQDGYLIVGYLEEGDQETVYLNLLGEMGDQRPGYPILIEDNRSGDAKGRFAVEASDGGFAIAADNKRGNLLLIKTDREGYIEP